MRPARERRSDRLRDGAVGIAVVVLATLALAVVAYLLAVVVAVPS